MKAIKSKVAGTTIDDRQETIRKYCNEGDELELKREKDNPYDQNAVGTWVKTGIFGRSKKIGYITRTAAKTVASALDNDEIINATINEVTGGTANAPNFGVNIELSEQKTSLKTWLIFAVIIYLLFLIFGSSEPEEVTQQAVKAPIKPSPNSPKDTLTLTLIGTHINTGQWTTANQSSTNNEAELTHIETTATKTHPATEKPPRLTISCTSNNIAISMYWPENKESAAAHTKLIDNGLVTSHQWHMSNNPNYFLPDINVFQLLDNLTQATTMRATIHPTGANAKIATFDLRNLYSTLLKSDRCLSGLEKEL